MLYYLEMLALMYLIKAVDTADDQQSMVFGFAVILPCLGIIFGAFFHEGYFLKPVLNLTKAISVICCAAFFRFMLVKVETESVFIGLLIFKYAYKTITYCVGIYLTDRVARKVFKKGETSATDYFD